MRSDNLHVCDEAVCFTTHGPVRDERWDDEPGIFPIHAARETDSEILARYGKTIDDIRAAEREAARDARL